jgi:hypothetical protein
MAAMLPLLIERIYEVCHWDGLRWHNILYIQSFMKTSTCVQAILSLRHSNLKGCNVGHFSHLDPPYQQCGYQLMKNIMMWKIHHGFLLGFSPECTVFTPQMALPLGIKWFHKILHLILYTDFLGRGFLHTTYTSLSILISGLCMLHHNFYCIFSCISLWQSLVSYLHGCSCTGMGCPVTEVSSFLRTKKSRCLSPHLGA